MLAMWQLVGMVLPPRMVNITALWQYCAGMAGSFLLQGVVSVLSYPFQFAPDDNSAVVIIDVNGGSAIQNKLLRGGLEIIKTFEGKITPIAGVPFVITGKTAAGTDYRGEFVTDKNGNILVEAHLADGIGRCVEPRTLRNRFQRVLAECGLPDVNFHVLRHSFATSCVENGMDIKSLSELLGHANVQITLNTYIHPSMEQKRQQLEQMAAIRGNRLGRESPNSVDVKGIARSLTPFDMKEEKSSRALSHVPIPAL